MVASSGPCVVSVRDLRVRYGGRNVVDGISFEVFEGEVFSLLGPNGAGKTTTVEVLEGHRPRSSGEVSVLGFDPANGEHAFRERIGIVLQEAGLESELTVRETVRLFAGLYPTSRDADEVIDLVQLDGSRRARVRTLSGGQRRRLDLALALVGDPAVLFLDEPTTGFDPLARRNAWSLLRELRALGKTVLLTTHYMDEVQQLADRVAVLQSGRIIAEGLPGSLAGRDHAKTEIRFTMPLAMKLRDLPGTVTALATVTAGELWLVTDEPTAMLAVLTSWAVARGLELNGLTVTRPSLEDVLLDLTTAAGTALAGAQS